MLTNADFKKLRKIFATKDDLKNFVTKTDLKNELKNYATKQDLKKMAEQIVTEITEVVGTLAEKIQRSLDELRSQRIILGDNEERIQRVEEKTFSQI